MPLRTLLNLGTSRGGNIAISHDIDKFLSERTCARNELLQAIPFGTPYLAVKDAVF